MGGGKKKNQMSKHKDKWYEPYKIVTALDKKETIRRIESKIMLKFAWSIENFLFYGKKTGDGEYKVCISPRVMPPRGNSNLFLPIIILEVIINSEGKSIIFFHLEPIKLVWVYLLGFLALILAETNVLVYACSLCLGAFLQMKYWEFVRRRVGQWLEELLEVKKETEE